MTRENQNVSDKEFEILQALWESGPLTMRQLAERLYPERSTPPVSNVQKLLERLDKKGLVSRDRTGDRQTFSALVAREELLDEQLQEMAERFCGGSITPLFSRLIQSTNLSSEEREELRALIESLDQKGKRRK